ncbi:MAG: hypothetical protein D6706_02025 [Chloroflexi bacterium]|nr:MAG: hypothetical protein D6706_02025 [Chloroflexota bacterium]
MLKRVWRLIVIVLGVMFAGGVTAVHAIYLTIDTNDGMVDTNWTNAAPDPYMTDGAGDTTATISPEVIDLLTAWVATDGSASTNYLYFRVDVTDASNPPVVHRVGAVFDCDNDGVVDPFNDLMVTYRPQADEVQARMGINNTPYYTGPATDGESVGNTYEWRVPKSVVSTNCAPVLSGAIRFQFIGMQSAGVHDEMSIGESWNSPTAVQLQSVSGTGSGISVVWLMVVFGLGGMTTAVIWRRRHDLH